MEKALKLKEEEIKKRIERYERLREYRGEDEIVSTNEMKDLVQKERERIKFSIPTPFKEINECIEGWHNGQLVTIGGLSGEGKTSLCQTLTYDMANQGIGVLWFTFEVPEGEFLMRMPLKNGELPVFYMPRRTKPRDINWLEDRIIEGLAKHPEIKAVFIDSIGFLFSEQEASSRNASLSIGGIIAKLKEMAILYNITIFLTTNLVKNIKEKTPSKDDIRDSGRLTDYSDIVLILWRMRTKTNTGVYVYLDNSLIKLEKNRWSGKYPHDAIEVQYRDNKFRDFILPDDERVTQTYTNEAVEVENIDNYPDIGI